MPVANVSLTTTFERVFSTTHPDIMPRVWDVITTDIPTIHYLADAGRIQFVGGGAALDFNIFKELINVVGYTPTQATLTPITPDPVTRGRYEWKNLAIPFKLPGPEITRNQGPNMVANLMAIVVEAVRASMVEGLGGSTVGIWSSADETQLGVVTGLGNLVSVSTADNATGTTGNISRATNTSWRNTIGTAITDYSAHGVARVRGALFDAQRGNETPDVIVLDSTSYQNHLSALTSTFRFNLPIENRVASTGMLEVGVPGINFHGALMIKDASVPTAGDVRGLNTKYIALRVHQDRNMQFSEWVSMLPAGEDAIAAALLWMGNLVATNLGQHFGLSGANTD